LFVGTRIVILFGVFVNHEMMSVAELLKALIGEWAKQPQNLDNVEKLLKQCDDAVASGNDKSLANMGAKEQELLRQHVLEITALTALRRHNFAAFETCMDELRAHYACARVESPQKMMLLGLDLMYKLAFDKMKEFHLTMCEYDYTVRSSNVYLKFPENLEENLSTGFYTRIAHLQNNAPSADYQLFFDKLMDTARDRSARSIERAYGTLTVSCAAQLLFFTGKTADANVREYAQKRKWTVRGNDFVFAAGGGGDQTPAAVGAQRITTANLIQHHLHYAKQLEKIV